MSQFSKYDRQLRLWGSEGQKALTTASICLLNASALGSETLKNLVLPGVGSFTIVDGEKVKLSDVGNHFFVLESDVGRSRAEAVTENLKELNPDDVEGHFVDESPSEVIGSKADFFSNFTLIIASQLRDAECQKLDKICQEAKIPLLVCRTYGLFGFLSISGGEHLVVESKPDFAVDDLRLSLPFAELKEHAEGIDLDKLDSTAHSHTPFPFVLLNLLKRWCNDREAPKNYDEKKEFKDFVQSSGKIEEENFAEAVKHANKLFSQPSVKSTVREILNNEKCDTDNGDFWIVACAIRDFWKENSQLPLTGSIPDMVSDSQSYYKLQQMYKTKATQDIADVTKRVEKLVQQRGLKPDAVDAGLVAQMCQHVHDMVCIQFSTWKSHKDLHADCSKELGMMLESNDSPLHVLAAVFATEHFASCHARLPGQFNSDDEEQGLLSSAASQVMQDLGIGTNNTNHDILQEMCRAGSSEPHTMAAIMGGVASQEVIKLLTHQLVPVNNTYVFDGIRGTSAAFRLR